MDLNVLMNLQSLYSKTETLNNDIILRDMLKFRNMKIKYLLHGKSDL